MSLLNNVIKPIAIWFIAITGTAIVVWFFIQIHTANQIENRRRESTWGEWKKINVSMNIYRNKKNEYPNNFDELIEFEKNRGKSIEVYQAVTNRLELFRFDDDLILYDRISDKEKHKNPDIQVYYYNEKENMVYLHTWRYSKVQELINQHSSSNQGEVNQNTPTAPQ